MPMEPFTGIAVSRCVHGVRGVMTGPHEAIDGFGEIYAGQHVRLVRLAGLLGVPTGAAEEMKRGNQ